MAGEPGVAFEHGVPAWRAVVGTVRDAVRQELVSRQLAAHLPTRGRPLSVLDVGCGQGTQALRLARLGHEVTGLDLSDELLEDARRRSAGETTEVQARLTFQHGDLSALDPRLVRRFDVVCCHGVLMYLPSLDDALAALATAVCSGGLLSVLTRNRAGIAMRAGMSGDWPAALDGFDAHRYRNRLGLDNVRADDPLTVRRALRRTGARTLAWYGVRLFSDHWPVGHRPDDLATLIAAEQEAGRRDPYRALAAMTHTIARVHAA